MTNSKSAFSLSSRSLALILTDTLTQCIRRNNNFARGKQSLHSRWNFISTFTEFTWPWRQKLTNGSDVKYVFSRCQSGRDSNLENEDGFRCELPWQQNTGSSELTDRDWSIGWTRQSWTTTAVAAVWHESRKPHCVFLPAKCNTPLQQDQWRGIKHHCGGGWENGGRRRQRRWRRRWLS